MSKVLYHIHMTRRVHGLGDMTPSGKQDCSKLHAVALSESTWSSTRRAVRGLRRWVGAHGMRPTTRYFISAPPYRYFNAPKFGCIADMDKT